MPEKKPPPRGTAKQQAAGIEPERPYTDEDRARVEIGRFKEVIGPQASKTIREKFPRSMVEEPDLDTYNAHDYLHGKANRIDTGFRKFGWMSVPDLHKEALADKKRKRELEIRDYMARPTRFDPSEHTPGSVLHGFKEASLGGKTVKYHPEVERNPLTGEWESREKRKQSK